jgi:hypothetical protein
VSISDPLGEPLPDGVNELLEVGHMDAGFLIMADRVNIVNSPCVCLKEPRAAWDLGFIAPGTSNVQYGKPRISTIFP